MNYRKLGILITLLAFVFFAILVTLLYYFEEGHKGSTINNLWDAVWFTVVTISTVGFGDAVPLTHAGRIIGIIIVSSSFLTMGYVVGNVSNKIRNFMEKKKLGLYGTDFKNHVVIIGWNKFGSQVAEQIINANHHVAIVTHEKNDIDDIYEMFGDKHVFALYSDFAHFESLKKVNIEHSSCVFVNFQDDTEALVYVINLKSAFSGLKFVVSLNNTKLKETFNSAGVTYAISKNEIASKLVASYIFEPDVADITEDFMSTAINANDYDIQEYRVTEKNPYLGKDYVDAFLDMKPTFNSILLGISKNHKLIKNPSKGVKIELDDYLILISNGEDKKKIEQQFGSKEGRL
jgi:voltage-gated potassium channel